MDLRVGKKTSTAKSYLAALREAYDRHAVPWLGGAKGSDPPPDPEAEQALAEDLPQLERLFRMVLGNYRQALDREWGLDFDDLEGGALALLEIPPVRRRWAGEFQAVLVDEFQDTNGRQRAIIDALTEDRPGKLFVVGDARQSIYRFRGADVAVFRDIQTDVEARGGARVDLDLTFRSHQALLNGLDGFLPAFMGTAPDPDRPYAVPYTRLEAFRKEPQAGTREPYLELILGLGERGDDARPEAARALAARLLALKDSGEIKEWDDVALLFRAATGFEAYEPALEAHSIPFVTVAGSGFYNRPEVRDLLNLLQALGEPWDDAAMAGLLRSPAIGMSDAGLYQLRWGPDGRRAFREALMSDLSALSESDQQAAGRAAAFLEALGPLVDRISVAALLKRVIDVLDLRALYAAGDPRLWRNIDKLLDDARASGLVRISAFFQYLRTLREVGAREGEAATEAVGSVSLMTIHKSKGLEFNVVVLADASRKPVERGEPVYIQPDVGLAWKPDRMGVNPIPYAIARWKDGQESAAEENRILYVAATRAREKLIISGHLSRRRGSWSAVGLTGEMLTLLGLDADEAAEELDIWHTLSLDGGAVVGLMVASPEQETRRAEGEAPTWPESDVRAMVVPLGGGETETLDPDLAHDPARDWRATGSRVHPPAVVVGLMVHRALECWLFPGDDGLAGLLETVAFREGLVDPGQRSRAIRRAKRLLDRFKAHPLWEEIGTAEARYHEVPYSRSSDNWIESGVVDLLYRSAEGWELLDFKADELADETALAEAVEEHHPQIARYEAACRVLLGGPVRARLCFLDGLGEVRVV